MSRSSVGRGGRRRLPGKLDRDMNAIGALDLDRYRENRSERATSPTRALDRVADDRSKRLAK